MLKIILACMLSIFIFTSCNTTAQFQKSFDNNQGVLVVPLAYLKLDTPDNITSLINHKLSLEIVNKATKKKITKSVVITLHNKYVVMNGFDPGAYEVVKSYYLKGAQKDIITEESIDFMIKPGEFTILPDTLHYRAYKDSQGVYWLTKRFIRTTYAESKKLKETMESMMPAQTPAATETSPAVTETAEPEITPAVQ